MDLIEKAPVTRAFNRYVAAYRHHSLMDQKYPARFIPSALGGASSLIGAALQVK